MAFWLLGWRDEFPYPDLALLAEASDMWKTPPWVIQERPDWREWALWQKVWLKAMEFVRRNKK